MQRRRDALPHSTANGRSLNLTTEASASVSKSNCRLFKLHRNGNIQDAAIDPTGHFLYVVNADSRGAQIGYNPYLSQYRILPDGRLQPLPTDTLGPEPGAEARAMAVDPRDRILFVSFQSGMDSYRIGADGRLTYIEGSRKENGFGFRNLLYDDKHYTLYGTVIPYDSGEQAVLLSVYPLKRGGVPGDQKVYGVSPGGVLTLWRSDTHPYSDAFLMFPCLTRRIRGFSLTTKRMTWCSRFRF
jgi:hypothetical protein